MPSMTLRQYEKSCLFFHNNEMAASKRRTAWMRERGIKKSYFHYLLFCFSVPLACVNFSKNVIRKILYICVWVLQIRSQNHA